MFRASPQQGVDEPRQRSYKATALDASYNAFDLDRYMLIEDSFALHRMAPGFGFRSCNVRGAREGCIPLLWLGKKRMAMAQGSA